MAKTKPCPACGARVKLENIERHLRSVHPGEDVSVALAPEERAVVAAARRGPPRPLSRRERKTLLVALVVVLAFALSLAFVPSLLPSGAPGDFVLRSTDGRTVRLSDLRGQVVFLDFFSTTCPACRRFTTEVLVDLYGTYGSRVAFVSIDVNAPGETTAVGNERIEAFRDATGATWTYCLDTAGVSRAWGVTATPTTYVVDRNGALAYHHAGYEDAPALAAVLEDVLA
jgi:cytochrome oxidase Cu insertion factor (SCO1/SenC/PrrC family)